MSAQRGLITRTQSLDLGLSPLSIRAAVRSGEWVVMCRGVYADAELWAALDEYRGRPLLRARAAVLTMRRDCVLSHDSAAHALELDILAPEKPFVHVTRAGFTGAWTKAGVKHHLAGFRPEQVVSAGGMPSLDLARTAVDIARERGFLHGLVAVDAALRMGVTRRQLEEALEPMTSWPGVTQARAAVGAGDPGAQTVLESLGRDLVIEMGIGAPDTQFPIAISSGIAWCDIRVGNHVFETDGWLKLVPVNRGGVATKSADEVLRDQRKRETLICREGLGMTRWVYADFFGARRAEAKASALRDYQVTLDRYGAGLPEHLARNAAEIRAREARRLTA
ncbi:MAG: type IV toxin-antitoxin system AbiEi family antitoxin domain-containing protein [Nocardioides sp.]